MFIVMQKIDQEQKSMLLMILILNMQPFMCLKNLLIHI